jgi:predicted nucleic-acid-binding Zn-ribbon protein
MRSNTCPKCQSTMAEGFVPDAAHGGEHKVSNWVEGQPERAFWVGIKLRGKRKLPISTWRCTRCGFLESYASA